MIQESARLDSFIADFLSTAPSRRLFPHNRRLADLRRCPLSRRYRLQSGHRCAATNRTPGAASRRRARCYHAAMKKPTFRGRALSQAELQLIRREVEGFDSIDVIDDEMRALIETQWPDLIAKLPPRKPN